MGVSHKVDDDVDEISEINLTPFIDVILVMLIIFMIAAQTSAVSQSVDLPGSRADPLRQQARPVVVAVHPDSTFAIEEKPVTPGQLRTALAAAGVKPDDRILLLGDKSLSYQALMDALDVLRAAGYAHVALVGREKGGQ